MKNIFLVLLLMSFIATSLSGCVPLVVGSAVGAVGGYAASKDTIEGDTDKLYDNIWNSAKEVARIRGTIKQENYAHGTLHLVASDSTLVWIRLVRLTRATTRVRVSCRRFHLPNLELAQELYTKIIEEAK
ncbi:MAG: DUF3568 domain-containing protein [Candidatus Omnitrophica bacterium]|nr:DUF3568 domain-containing protein [Candidatus Omnitrophota bacterium]